MKEGSQTCPFEGIRTFFITGTLLPANQWARTSAVYGEGLAFGGPDIPSEAFVNTPVFLAYRKVGRITHAWYTMGGELKITALVKCKREVLMAYGLAAKMQCAREIGGGGGELKFLQADGCSLEPEPFFDECKKIVFAERPRTDAQQPFIAMK